MIDLTTYIRPEALIDASLFGDMIRVSAGADSTVKIHTARPEILALLAADPRQQDVAVGYKCLCEFLKQGPVVIRPPYGLCRALANTDLPIPMAEYRQPFPVLGIEWPKEVSGAHHPILTLIWRPSKDLLVVNSYSRVDDYGYQSYFVDPGDGQSNTLDEILAGTRSMLEGPEEANLSVISRMAINLGLLLTSKGYSVSRLDDGTRKKRSHKDPRVRHLACRRAQLVEFIRRPMFLKWKDLDWPPGISEASGEKRPPQFRRGHWKRVAYGPASSLRKLEWIEPYWTGGGPNPDQQSPGVLLD